MSLPGWTPNDAPKTYDGERHPVLLIKQTNIWIFTGDIDLAELDDVLYLNNAASLAGHGNGQCHSKHYCNGDQQPTHHHTSNHFLGGRLLVIVRQGRRLLYPRLTPTGS